MLVFVLVCVTLCPFCKICSRLGGVGVGGLWLLCFYCLVNVGVLWLFFTVSWVGLGYVVVVFPGRSCSLTFIYMQKKLTNIQIQSFVLIMTAGLDTSDIYATEVSYFMCLQRKIHDLCSRK